MSSAKCTVVGFIRRLETKQLPSGTTVCEFSIPVDKKWKDKNTGEDREVTSWMNVVAMGKQAEIVDQYFEVGKGIIVYGDIEIQEWEKDGEKRSKMVIKMQSFDFAPAARDDAGQVPQQQSQPSAKSAPAPQNFGDFDDDIPF